MASHVVAGMSFRNLALVSTQNQQLQMCERVNTENHCKRNKLQKREKILEH